MRRNVGKLWPCKKTPSWGLRVEGRQELFEILAGYCGGHETLSGLGARPRIGQHSTPVRPRGICEVHGGRCGEGQRKWEGSEGKRGRKVRSKVVQVKGGGGGEVQDRRNVEKVEWGREVEGKEVGRKGL